MAASECTRLACYLAGQEGKLPSLALVTVAGIVDGINPCAIGMMVLLLGYLLVFSEGNENQIKARRRVLLLGITYILTVFLTYLIVGLAFYSALSSLPLDTFRSVVNPIIGVLLGIAAVIQIKDFFKPEWPIHLRIPTASKEKLMPLIEKSSFPTTILLGIFVTLLETPCSLPLYVGTASHLANSGIPMFAVALYFLYYNFLFVLPLIVVLVIVLLAKRVVQLREWEHHAERWMKLAIGVVLVIMSAYLLFGSKIFSFGNFTM
jgi:cytochrome c biogenesis protein CcdA